MPSDLVSTISPHLRRSAETCPVVFNLPSSYLLSRILSPPTPITLPTVPQIPVPPVVASIITPPLTPQSSPAQMLAKSLKLSSLFWVHPTVRRALTGSEDLSRATSKKRSRPASFIAPSNGSLDVSVPYRPKVMRNCSSPSMVQGQSKPERRRSDQPSSLTVAFPPAQQATPVISVPVPPVPLVPANANTKLLGNLYMSSCPGKKVRLDGPVRGRNTVCRDLRSDLSRIKGAGATCIVCCLDDAELKTLGVTWSAYARTADELGIDVLRIPIPEGLAPMDPATLDSHLTQLLESYTLRGKAILVHCRGGVGRAGIIACCWMLKLGLCGWVEPVPDARETPPRPTVSGDDAVSQAGGGQVSRETVRLVERLISVVRRRRSLKAIETYEQVKFLVDYVEFLRDQTSTRTPFSADLFADWDAQVE